MKIQVVYIAVCIICFHYTVFAQYKITKHRALHAGEIPVVMPGSFDKEGATYVLTKNIESPVSPVFLGKNVIIDLNGYTIKFANASYSHIPNSGFEEGPQHWDLSKAPGARVMNTADVHVFLGAKLLSLQKGDVVTSGYVYLPVANRSYFAMCGVTGRHYSSMYKYPDDEMRLSIYVEDEKGNDIKCMMQYGDTTMLSCPVENRSPRLGGGFIYAHLNNLPAGKYRVRVKADTDCLVDEIDIRPAMDAGISIIEQTKPYAHYDHVFKESWPPVSPAFFDYTGNIETGEPSVGIPQIKGEGMITIKNGIIESAVEGTLSWGIQSTAKNVKVVLDNVQVKNSGISSGAADILWADISNCRFDVQMPFLIQRHVNLCSVVLQGDQPSEIRQNYFNGGQGNLSVKGKYSLIHDNIFVNDQTVTNHYSIMGTGDSSKIYNNRFEPRQGSGIYVSRFTEVYNNFFRIETSPPTCEYGREEYSTAAIRLGDYGAAPGSPKASVGNRIHHNKFEICARTYPAPKEYLPMAWGIFYSASGGENYVHDNEFLVNKTDTSSRLKTAALYICGGPKYFGGQFYNNRITTNVPAAWIATIYGGASNSNLYNNTIIPLNNSDFKTFSIGYSGCNDCVAKNVAFRSNRIEGKKFELDVTTQNHSYAVYWTLKMKLVNPAHQPIANREVLIYDKNKAIAYSGVSDKTGFLKTELLQYSVGGNQKKLASPYTISIGRYRRKINLENNTNITCTINER